MATDKEIHTPMTQREGALAFAAAGTPLNAQGTARTARPSTERLQLAAANAEAAAQQSTQTPPTATCQQCLTLNFFFDGTGNNIGADVGTMQHSNVARLFQIREDDDKSIGRYSFYIPGLGTYFKDIGDPGNTNRGLGMGHRGQDRLDWAFKQFDEKLKAAEARAQNPTNKIRSIKLSVFGFSRGATAARAFVRDMAARCNIVNGEYRLKQGNYPIEVMFLGIFDTVASVGLPMSANNTPGATTAGLYGVRTTMSTRDLMGMAFGEPGADPSRGSFDGHARWADGLQIPSPGFVKSCVHMVAGHEIRNSFPVDSALHGTRYPDGTAEMVYPGAHSDVGGGYQPGEGARSPHHGDMLSLIPLRVMHERARAAGVPLRSLSDIAQDGTGVEKKSFALDEEGAKKFAELSGLFNHYMSAAGSGGRDVGRELLAHSAWYLRWRFFNIRRNQRSAGGQGPDAQAIAQREPGFAAERKRLSGLVAEKREVLEQAELELERANLRLQSARQAEMRFGFPVPADIQQGHTIATAKEQLARDAYLSEKAKLDTYADDSALPGNLSAYDERLVQDASAIDRHQKNNPKLKLRPHYRNLVEAYQAHYVRSEPLDEKIVAFFDRYVHDSLAGFAKDATLPSDPRVIYVGGDNKLRYAAVESSDGVQQSKAA